jgi:hypothetical protein
MPTFTCCAELIIIIIIIIMKNRIEFSPIEKLTFILYSEQRFFQHFLCLLKTYVYIIQGSTLNEAVIILKDVNIRVLLLFLT